jgi:hypothetical protein
VSVKKESNSTDGQYKSKEIFGSSRQSDGCTWIGHDAPSGHARGFRKLYALAQLGGNLRDQIPVLGQPAHGLGEESRNPWSQ